MEVTAPVRVAAPNRPLQLFVAVVALGGAIAAALAIGLPVGPALHIDETVVILALAVLCAEAFPVQVARRNGSESFDVGSVFLLAAAVTLGPATAVAIEGLTYLAIEIATRQQPIKAVFNVGQRVLSIAAAGAAAVLVAGDPVFAADGITLHGIAAFVAAAGAYIAVNGLLVTMVCALSAREPVLAFIRRELLRPAPEELLLGTLAPVAAAVAFVDPLLLPLLAVPAWALHRSGRAAAASYHQARHDTLTGLPNRMKMREDLDIRFRQGGAIHELAFVISDLARFKDVNDTLGHRHGDRLLVAAADRLAELVGDAGVLARLQGDEFGILVEGDARAAEELTAGIVEAFQVPIEVDGLSLEIGISAGVAVAGEDVDTVDELLRRADVAMSGAKGHAVAAYTRYDAERDHFSRRRLALTGDLRRAIAAGEVQPFFQPQVDLGSDRVVGAEALIRWVLADGTLVPPMDFIPHAERSGVIKPLTLHVLEAALDARLEWATAGTPVRMAVNLSARSLLDPELVGDVARLLRQTGVEPDALELEVTESAIMGDPDRARRTLEGLHELGVRLAIDDFGTGYSSLAYLSRLPVHAVKIDRAFVRDLDSDPAAELIVRMTVDLGHNLGLTVVAEGVEDAATRDRLRELGCDTAQGFLWSPAVPADRFRATAAELSPSAAR